MDEDMKKFFEPWELKMLEIIEKVENSRKEPQDNPGNVIVEVTDKNS